MATDIVLSIGDRCPWFSGPEFTTLISGIIRFRSNFLRCILGSIGAIVSSGIPAAEEDAQPLAVFCLAGVGNLQGRGLIGDDSAVVAPNPGTLRDMVVKNREERAKRCRRSSVVRAIGRRRKVKARGEQRKPPGKTFLVGRDR